MVSNSVVVCTSRHQYWRPSDGPEGASYCLSWRLAVEANNVRAWRTVPTQCLRHVENYMIGGQYDRDINFIIDHVISYIDGVDLSNDGLDAWILDVDDTCLSNLIYYKGKRFGCDPYDPDGFKTWALRGGCPAIPGVLRLFNKLIGNGFKVFLVTGRDESTFGQATLDNLQNQGFIGYQRLILSCPYYTTTNGYFWQHSGSNGVKTKMIESSTLWLETGLEFVKTDRENGEEKEEEREREKRGEEGCELAVAARRLAALADRRTTATASPIVAAPSCPVRRSSSPLLLQPIFMAPSPPSFLLLLPIFFSTLLLLPSLLLLFFSTFLLLLLRSTTTQGKKKKTDTKTTSFWCRAKRRAMKFELRSMVGVKIRGRRGNSF